MTGSDRAELRAGFIPLVDSAILVAAADKGFAAEEGIALELVREVSWSNIRDRLALGHFDVAHCLAPLAVAVSLGLDYARVPMVVPLALNLNGNSIIVSAALHAALKDHCDGELDDPRVSGAALARVIASRKEAGAEKLTFAMTFPFSTHNYQLRFWIAAAGIDPDEDMRLIVLPPPYMVDSLARGHVHGCCVGAPWPSVGVEAKLGTILHFGTDIVASCPEKVLAVREAWADGNRETLLRLVRACTRAAAWCTAPEHRGELAQLLSSPHRLGVSAEVIKRTLDGRLVVDADGRVRTHPRYLALDPPLSVRPDPKHAVWLYAQMVRWKQAQFTSAIAAQAAAVYRPDLFDAAQPAVASAENDGIGAFAGPAFDPDNVPAHLMAWSR